ncbi:MAG: YlxR family protein [Clostridia bacterium]|nr:YlxR family protein [Clostridia bacterium]
MKNPLRMCIVNREMLPKSELVRLVKVNGKILIDKKNNIQTRGVWVCRSSECIAKLKKTKCLNRAFKCDVPEEVYKEIEDYLVNGLK